MLIDNGTMALNDFSTSINDNKPKMQKIGEIAYFFSGYGTSNVIAIEGKTSIILIDTLETPDMAAQVLADLQAVTNKPVKTIIYTHGHLDHRGGSTVFQETATTILAFKNQDKPLANIQNINHVLNVRGAHQNGRQLNSNDGLNVGHGKLETKMLEQRTVKTLMPTEYLPNGVSARVIDGITFQLSTAPGETGDMGYVWLPDYEILCCGDNYYGCFPDLAPIRGGQYRDIGNWLKSLDLLVSYDAKYVLPGHLEPLIGYQVVKTTLSNYRDALKSIFDQTLLAINEGLSIEEVLARVKLADNFAKLPYLAEIYGTVEWSVRAIFSAYVGWFDGNPTNLHVLPQRETANKMITLIGGPAKVEIALDKAVNEHDFLWGLELCDLLIAIGRSSTITTKVDILRALGQEETTITGQHYYLSVADDLVNKMKP